MRAALIAGTSPATRPTTISTVMETRIEVVDTLNVMSPT